MNVSRLILVPALLAAQCARTDTATPPAEPSVSTTVLPGTSAPNGEAFEPSVAIDATNPDRILVAAMYGNPGGRGGRNIWAWQSEDAGKTWSSGRMRPPLIEGKESGWAADPVAGFGPDGAAIITSMAGADKPRIDGYGGIVVSRRARGDSAFGEPVFVMRDSIEASGDHGLIYDKPWLAVDREAASPHRGNVYLICAILDMDIPSESWARTPVSLDRISMLGLDFSVSRDTGRSFGPVRRAVDSVFGSDMAIGPTGALDVVYQKSIGSRSAILNLRSTDGGATFAAPDTVTIGDGASFGAMVASRPGGETMSCWSESGPGRPSPKIRCAVRAAGGTWGQRRLEVPLPAGAIYAFPTSAGTAKGWYLLMHLVGSDTTETVIFRSDGRSDFTRFATVATIPGLGLGKWCFARECRFDRDDLFMAGDYISIAATGGRLVAGYVLPRPAGELVGRAAVHLSVVTEP